METLLVVQGGGLGGGRNGMENLDTCDRDIVVSFHTQLAATNFDDNLDLPAEVSF